MLNNLRNKISAKQPLPWCRGQAMIVATVFFIAGSLIILGGVARPLLQDTQNIRQLVDSKKSFFFSEGGVEDVVFRINSALPISLVEELVMGSYRATTTIATISGRKEIIAVGDTRNAFRKNKVVLQEGIGASFNYGMQSDKGGISMHNSSTVTGNVYSNGPVVAFQDNAITGDVISAGPSGIIDGVNVAGTAYAHTITDSIIEGDAHYQVASGNSITGTPYPGSPDQATTSLPISDADIAMLEGDAVSGGVIASTDPECSTGTYTINSSTIIGPLKIECNLLVDKSSTVLTLAGTIWVLGNFETKNGPTIRIDPALSDMSVPIIVNNPANRVTSSQVALGQSVKFVGAAGNSFVVLISQNNDAENGGSNIAISTNQSSKGDLLLYAAHGKVSLQQSADLKEVTAYSISLHNTANVTYESGFASVLFTSGPSGGFSIDTWKEVE